MRGILIGALGILAPVVVHAQDARATVTIRLVVPVGIVTDSVWIAGNLVPPAWRADGARMTRDQDGSYRVSLQLPMGAALEYKFTRGSWETVEKSAAGADISNRRARVTPGLTIVDTVRMWGRGSTRAVAGANGSRVGLFRLHANVRSRSLANTRTVLVYLPPGYDDASRASERYPVLYMHDGQNLFDRATGFGGQEWELDETAERLIREGKIQPIIIVGIYNTGARMTEYTPVGATPAPGRTGDDYARFIIDELKPMIDSAYRTKRGRDDTAIAGSSLGGLISLLMALHHPDVFGKAGVVSPWLFWYNGQLLREADSSTAVLRGARWWLDIGTNEGGTARGETVPTAVVNARRLAATFARAGLTAGKEFVYLEVPGGEHNERSWARRMDQMLLFLFSSSERR